MSSFALRAQPRLRRTTLAIAAAITLSVALLPPAATATAGADRRAAARALVTRYFDAIRRDDKATVCHLYTVSYCATGERFAIAAFDVAAFERLHPPAAGDFGALVLLHARPTRGSRASAYAFVVVVVTCGPRCRISSLYAL